MTKIAFIGLGNMGGGMAANQAKAGHAVAAFDLSPSALERAASQGCTPVGSVAEAVKDERLARLNALIDEQQRAFNAAQVGKVLPVLFEKPGRHPGQLSGRSPYLQAVHVEGPERLIGQIVPVRIETAHKMSLAGVLEMETA